MKKRQKKKIALPEETAGTWKKHLTGIALLAISAALAYSNSLNGTWAMDDVVANKSVSISNLHDVLGFRKVSYFTFLLNQSIAPFTPAYFRLFNILVHILNGVLIYILAHMTITIQLTKNQEQIPEKNKNLSLTTPVQAFYAALLSSAIFALHPININAVAYIVQRMTSLATLFVLLSLLFYILATQSRSGFAKISLYLLSSIFVVLGIFSKENALMGIPLIILYDYFFLPKFKRNISLKRAFVIAVIVVLIIGVASYFLKFHITLIELMRFFSNPTEPLTKRGWMAVDVYWTPLQHVLTEFRVVSRYIFLLFIPFPQFLVFDHWGFPVSNGITEPLTTLLSIILLSSLFIFSLWKLKRFPLLCFGMLWYFIAISLESFFALGSDLYFEHRNYLPLSGLIIGIVGQVIILLKGRIRERSLRVSVFILCIAFGSLTFSRNFVWKDSLTLWSDTLNKSPSNLRAMMSIGNAYLVLSDMYNAEKYYKKVVQISSNDQRVHFLNESAYSLGMLYLLSGKLELARELIERFDYSVESYSPRILKGYYKALNGNVDGAIRDYNEIINETKDIDKIVVLTLMGDAYREKGLWDDAIERYTEAISLDSGFSAAYYGIGASYLSKGNIKLANDYLNKTLSIDPNHALALSDMADLMLIMKSNPEEALIYAQRAISKSPPFYQPYLTMGNVLIALGREEEAEVYYKKALEHGSKDYMILFSKARAYYIKGEEEKAVYYLSELRGYKDLPDKIRNIIKQKN